MQYYEVAPTKIVRQGQATFTYCSETKLAVGQLVHIPIGKTTQVGLIMDHAKKPAYDTKHIQDVLPVPPLPLALIHTAAWMSDYYATPLATVLQTILPRGLTKVRRAATTKAPKAHRERTNFVFTAEQSQAITELSGMSPGTAILHGVTGSGKTAVYIELARHTLAGGKSVIVLVPEIALTSQLVAEFQNHFNDIIVTHSKQTEADRHTAWLGALTSTAPRVVIGPRSALFMPAPNVGLIIIDEAHEPAYKQDQSPRYSALRVASVLASHNKGRVIQGTATPLVSEYYLAQHAKRPIITMQSKAQTGTQPASVTLVDMTKKTSFSEHRLFSNELLAALRAAQAAGQQSLIFHNRRGSASTTLCEACGWSAICPRCFIPYTLHADSFTLRCHVCASTARVPTSCPECHSAQVIHKGIGTKLIESELTKLFPKSTIMRFDGDAANADTVENRYNELYRGAIDIIIGTQVVAKGLDLPKLTTVGVVQADAGLALPDYAASERTFQLLAQVIGRVGRTAQQSTIVIQSYQPEAPAVKLGIAQDYIHFYQATLAQRQQGSFPPFTYLLKLVCVYKTEAAAVRNAQALAKQLQQNHANITILGPVPAFYERQRDTYRWQITVKSSSRATLSAIAATLPPQWQYDLDPMTLL